MDKLRADYNWVRQKRERCEQRATGGANAFAYLNTFEDMALIEQIISSFEENKALIFEETKADQNKPSMILTVTTREYNFKLRCDEWIPRKYRM